MYDLKTFLRDFIRSFKRIPPAARWGIVIIQIVLGFNAFVVCVFAFRLPIAETVTYCFIIPALAIWIPILWKKWERTDG